MAAIAPLDFYADAGLVSRLPAQLDMLVTAPNGSVDVSFYVGSPAAAGVFKSTADPAAEIEVSLTPSAEVLATEVRLALAQADLDAATPGGALALGTSISAGQAVQVWLRFTDSSGQSGVYSGAKLALTPTSYYASA